MFLDHLRRSAYGASSSRKPLERRRVLRKLDHGLCLLLSVCSIGLPFVAQAQQTVKVFRLAIICGTRCEGAGYDALSAGLRELGWIEGRNLTIDRRGANGQQDRLPELAAELVARRRALSIAVAPQPTRAAKDAAGAIPIVMVAVADPVGVGLVPSLARPGGTITGFTTLVPGGFGGKSLELLTQ